VRSPLYARSGPDAAHLESRQPHSEMSKAFRGNDLAS
jgi:hypothetical protein